MGDTISFSIFMCFLNSNMFFPNPPIYRLDSLLPLLWIIHVRSTNPQTSSTLTTVSDPENFNMSSTLWDCVEIPLKIPSLLSSLSVSQPNTELFAPTVPVAAENLVLVRNPVQAELFVKQSKDRLRFIENSGRLVAKETLSPIPFDGYCEPPITRA